MSFHFALPAGTQMKFLTAGKYCDRDILVAGEGYTDADMQAQYSSGLADGTAACVAKHFTHNFVGDGTGSVSFHIPFEPDFLQIIGLDPTFNKRKDSLGSFTADLRAFGLVAGFCTYGTSTGVTNSMYSTTSILNRYSRSANGLVTIKDFASATTVVFDPNYHYTVIAVKYTNQTDKDRITAFVNGLTESGSVALNESKVTAAFTDNEWAALIATKPNWTFSWI